MLSSLMVLVSSSLLAAETTTVAYEAGVMTEVRSRTAVEPGQEADTTGEVGITPRLTLEVEGSSDLYRLSYFPRIFGQLNSAGHSVEVLHQASLSSRWNPTPTWQILGSVTASYGLVDQLASRQNITAGGGSGTGTPEIQATAPLTVLKQVSGGGLLTIEHRPAPRWRLQTRGGFSISGGADAKAQQSLPLHYGPRVAAEVEWSASPTDALVTTVTGSATRYLVMGLAGSSTEYTLDRFIREVTLVETWRHNFTPTVLTWVGAGVSFVHLEGVGQPAQRSIHPTGEIGVRRETQIPGTGWSGSLSARTWAAQDVLTGLVNERVDAALTLGYWLARQWRIDGRGSGGVVIEKGEQYGDTFADGELRLTFAPQSDLRVAGGLRILGQQETAVSNQAFIQWGAFLEFEYTFHQRRPPAPPETVPQG